MAGTEHFSAVLYTTV